MNGTSLKSQIRISQTESERLVQQTALSTSLSRKAHREGIRMAQLNREPHTLRLALGSLVFLIRAFEHVYYSTQVHMENRISTIL